MKQIILLSFSLFLFISVIAQESVLKDGSVAPEFSLPDTQGKIVNLSDFKGKFVVLEFWASWCPHCRKEIPRLKEFYSNYKESVVMVGIACKDKKEPWLKIIADSGIHWINIIDESPELTKTYNIKVYPSKIIVGPDGKIVELLPGVAPDIFSRLEKTVNRISGGKTSQQEY